MGSLASSRDFNAANVIYNHYKVYLGSLFLALYYFANIKNTGYEFASER